MEFGSDDGLRITFHTCKVPSFLAGAVIFSGNNLLKYE